MIWICFPFRTKLWLLFCRCIETSLEKLNKNYRICSKHFTPSMFLNNLRNKLQPHAIPTINLSINVESLSVNVEGKNYIFCFV